jgi:hypothetical protein
MRRRISARHCRTGEPGAPERAATPITPVRVVCHRSERGNREAAGAFDPADGFSVCGKREAEAETGPEHGTTERSCLSLQ